MDGRGQRWHHLGSSNQVEVKWSASESKFTRLKKKATPEAEVAVTMIYPEKWHIECAHPKLSPVQDFFQPKPSIDREKSVF